MGLRDSTVGTDLKKYLFFYENVKTIASNGNFGHMELGYGYLNIIFHEYLSANFQFFIFIISGFILFSFIKYVYKYSENPFISIIMYLSIGIFSVNMTTLRQSIAISFTLFAYTEAEKKCFSRFMFLIFLSFLFHQSSIIFSIVYFLWGVKINKKIGFIILLVIILSFFYRIAFNNVIKILMPNRYHFLDLEREWNVNMLVILVPICISLYSLAFLPLEFDNKMSELNSISFIFSCLNVLFIILSKNNAGLGRLAFYYTPGNVVILPAAIKNMRKNNGKLGIIIEMIILLLCCLYFFISAPGGGYHIDQYKFFWQT